jgi:hypothetical protein
MYIKIDTFEERNNAFFNSMLQDLNPRIYAISTDRFVYQDKQTKITGQIPLPNANVIVYINGKESASVLADGDGKFTTYVSFVDNENNITVDYS